MRGLSHGSEEISALFEHFRLAADHDGERRVPRADVAARDGRIERSDALFLRCSENLLGERRTRRRHVDDDAAFLCRKDALGAQIDFLDVLRVADDGNDDVRLFRQLFWRRRPACAVFKKRLRLFLRARVDADGIARLHEIPRHTASHDARADEADLFSCHTIHPPLENASDPFSSRTKIGASSALRLGASDDFGEHDRLQHGGRRKVEREGAAFLCPFL